VRNYFILRKEIQLSRNAIGAMTELTRTGISSRLIVLTTIAFLTLTLRHGRCNITTFLKEDIEIPIYDIPVAQEVRTH